MYQVKKWHFALSWPNVNNNDVNIHLPTLPRLTHFTPADPMSVGHEYLSEVKASSDNKNSTKLISVLIGEHRCRQLSTKSPVLFQPDGESSWQPGLEEYETLLTVTKDFEFHIIIEI